MLADAETLVSTTVSTRLLGSHITLELRARHCDFLSKRCLPLDITIIIVLIRGRFGVWHIHSLIVGLQSRRDQARLRRL